MPYNLCSRWSFPYSFISHTSCNNHQVFCAVFRSRRCRPTCKCAISSQVLPDWTKIRSAFYLSRRVTERSQQLNLDAIRVLLIHYSICTCSHHCLLVLTNNSGVRSKRSPDPKPSRATLSNTRASGGVPSSRSWTSRSYRSTCDRPPQHPHSLISIRNTATSHSAQLYHRWT